MPPITFVIPVGNDEIYQRYFLSSPLFKRQLPGLQILAQRGFKTSGQAFNDAIDKAINDVIVCLHQDVVLPAMWAERFLSKLKELESRGVPVGVVGCIGINSKRQRVGHVYHRDRELTSVCPLPAPVETLDELLISFRKSSGLRFDPYLPSFFVHGVDLCLEARSRGLQSFAVDAPVVHQTVDRILPAIPLKGFYAGWEYIIQKWSNYLPIRSLSGTFAGKWAFRMQRLKDLVLHVINYSPPPWWTDLPQVDLAATLAADGNPVLLEMEENQMSRFETAVDLYK